jgi:heptaprenyl diphosphate synthase
MMALLNRLLKNRHLWFISLIGAVFHNFGQILAAMVVMQSKQVLVYLPFLLVSGCITGLFTGIAADRAVYVLRKIGIKNKF